MAITRNSIKSLCFSNNFLFMLLFSIPLLHCSPERRQEFPNQLEINATQDCLLEEGLITDDTNSILVSPAGMFEFGFFTPDEKANGGRYLGIWYNQPDPKIVVWVANRDEPLSKSSGHLVLKDGNAKLLDEKGVLYWSTDDVSSDLVRLQNSTPTLNGSKTSNISSPNELLHLTYVDTYSNPHAAPKGRNSSSVATTNRTRISTRLCLKDNGNLILDDTRRLGDPVLWQSFSYPTDTILPGMDATLDGSSSPTSSINLISWRSHNNPAKGSFSFLLQPGTVNEWDVDNGHSHRWQSTANPFDKFAAALFQPGIPSLENNTRLVMNSTGQIQLWNWKNRTGWSLNWSEPKDMCSFPNNCGDFGSCNSRNGKMFCKCLPGFHPGPKWKSGDTSAGCSRISKPPNDRVDSLSDTFFPLPMVALGNGTCIVSNEENCSAACLNDDNCVAYSYGFDCSGASTSTGKRCLMWKNVLTDLQEEYPDGITIYVRTTHYDIVPTSRECSPCGSYIVPYPLSTGTNCGDPSYFNFHCNNETGQLNFTTAKGNFRVSLIDPDAKKFSVQVMSNSCDAIDLAVLSHEDSLPFTFKNCNVFKNQSFTQYKQHFTEVEFGWEPPPQPLCSASSDCNHWPHTTCKRTKEGKMRCICRSKFHWNGMKLECTRVRFPLQVAAPCIAGAFAVFIVCILFLIYHIRKRKMAKGQASFEFKVDDTEGIDVPSFDWENILAATNNFADANRLGIGGFGSVYMGKLPDGQTIAVKRLSSVSVQGIEEFRTEVLLIAKLQHRNLVKLLGYCMKADEKILVYEFMSNGSLDSFLFDEQHFVSLDWKKRFEIILGIARGLLYLHQDSRLRIIHRDLKPSNILLDDELNPKISDFGIARIVGGKETQASTGRVVGTYGYMSPEYAYEGIFSVKSDVFSFGVVILETISGRRNSRIYMFEHGLSLLAHAWKLWNEDKGLELMDPKLNESCIPSEVLKCIHIGLLCVQEDPSDRPTMSTVVQMLSVENASLPPAKQPAFINRKPLSESASSSSVKDMSMLNEMMTVSTVGR